MQKSPVASQGGTPDPRVTVFIPAFNAERYISAAIESVLVQTYMDFELLVIDDGSTDGTADVIRQFTADNRLRTVTHTRNRGRPEARNHGLRCARGEFIAFLDADDVCAPHRLERQIEYLDTNQAIDGLGGWMAWIDEDGKPLQRGVYQLPLAPDLITCQMLVDCPLANPTMMVRKIAFTNYRYDSSFRVSQDYELWARMIRSCRFANLPEVVTYYRYHANQATITHGQMQKAASLAIYSQQIAALQIQHSESDLIRHECLFKFEGRQPVLERTGAPLDIHYLRWARAWLEKLLEANAHHRIYPEPAFSQMLVERWLFACRKAARNSPTHWVAREFFASPLRHPVTSSYAQRLRNFFKIRL